MAIASTIQHFLTAQHIAYDTLEHTVSESSSDTAERAHIPGSRLVKAIVVKCQNTYKLALLPASHHLRLNKLQDILQQKVELAQEEELAEIFNDCDQGAIPALGMAYGLDVIVDDSLSSIGEVFFEGGDHQTLVHMQADHFEELFQKFPHGNFSRFDKHPQSRAGFRFSHS